MGHSALSCFVQTADSAHVCSTRGLGDQHGRRWLEYITWISITTPLPPIAKFAKLQPRFYSPPLQHLGDVTLDLAALSSFANKISSSCCPPIRERCHPPTPAALWDAQPAAPVLHDRNAEIPSLEFVLIREFLVQPPASCCCACPSVAQFCSLLERLDTSVGIVFTWRQSQVTREGLTKDSM